MNSGVRGVAPPELVYEWWYSYDSDDDVATEDATESDRWRRRDCSAADGILYDWAWICIWYDADWCDTPVRLEMGGSENGVGTDGAEIDEVTLGRASGTPSEERSRPVRRGGLPPTLVVNRRRTWTSSWV